MEYEHPQYLVLREALKEPHVGAITVANATGGAVGSTFRTFHKAVVFGVTGICSAAGSGGTAVITVGRIQGAGGTASLTTYVLSPTTLAAIFAVLVVGLAVTRIHLRVQTTLIGYEIGRLKHDEARLLEERGSLKMQLAKLTTKKHLMLMTDEGGRNTKLARGTLALK